jgi:hypothetical protein
MIRAQTIETARHSTSKQAVHSTQECKKHSPYLVFLEQRRRGLLEAHGNRRDRVVVRTALQRREDGVVDLGLQVVHLVGLAILARLVRVARMVDGNPHNQSSINFMVDSRM